ncbi:uncharacterized protein PADG_00830 [Paracoccidioides brasiliensis Pb18]|uniref:Uncharacterized protein n=1 Tax=Paracoccidioides brasiliensis (strain Pb18) TaxID=502780 RepID=C1FYF4_PARBD|nr:uncharacterized protein PADG_00830 [Paracoccidioides brasiliensis Pb18]EEH44541.2 hypothetical protein PADG_00830 [Paracoccidioides brasiliensis Pb18]
MPSYHRYTSLVVAQLALASAWERLHDPLRIRQHQNLQVFNHGLTGVAPAITNSGHRDKPFEVDGEMFIVNEVHGINFTDQDCQSERGAFSSLLPNTCFSIPNVPVLRSHSSLEHVKSCNVAQESAPMKYFIEHVQRTAAASSESALAPTSPSHQVVIVLDDEFELLCDAA